MKTFDDVKLVKDCNGLPAGTIGMIVLKYDGTVYEVEFIDDDGHIIDVLTTSAEFLGKYQSFC